MSRNAVSPRSDTACWGSSSGCLVDTSEGRRKIAEQDTGFGHAIYFIKRKPQVLHLCKNFTRNKSPSQELSYRINKTKKKFHKGKKYRGNLLSSSLLFFSLLPLLSLFLTVKTLFGLPQVPQNSSLFAGHLPCHTLLQSTRPFIGLNRV